MANTVAELYPAFYPPFGKSTAMKYHYLRNHRQGLYPGPDDVGRASNHSQAVT